MVGRSKSVQIIIPMIIHGLSTTLVEHICKFVYGRSACLTLAFLLTASISHAVGLGSNSVFEIRRLDEKSLFCMGPDDIDLFQIEITWLDGGVGVHHRYIRSKVADHMEGKTWTKANPAALIHWSAGKTFDDT